MDTTVLGIDLGTTRLRAAVASGRSVRAVLGIDAPCSSAVAESDGSWRFGAEPAEGVIDRWKWLLGRGGDIDAGWIATDVLQQVLARCLRTPQSPHLGVLTVPSSFDDAARAALSNSCRMAGLALREMLSETSALACEQLPLDASGRVVAFVGGAGHVEVAILEAGEGVLAVRARRSLRSVHGDNYAHAVAQCLLHDLGEKTGQDLRQDRALLAHLVRPVQSALEAWNGVTDLRVQLPPACAARVQGLPEWTVPQTALHAVTTLCAKHLTPVFQAALTDARCRVGDIDRVLVCGGLARASGLAPWLQEFWGRPVNLAGAGSLALGAARHGAGLAGLQSTWLLHDTPSLEPLRAHRARVVSSAPAARVATVPAAPMGARVASVPAAPPPGAMHPGSRFPLPPPRLTPVPPQAPASSAPPPRGATAPAPPPNQWSRSPLARPPSSPPAAPVAVRPPSSPPAAPVTARPPSSPPEAPVTARPPSSPPEAPRPPSTPPSHVVTRSPSSPPPIGEHASSMLSQGSFHGVGDIEAFRALPLTRSPTAEEVRHPTLPVLLLWVASQQELHGVLTLTSGNDRIDLTFIDRGPVTYFAERKRQLRIFGWSSGTYTWSPMPPSAHDMKNREPMMSFLASGLREVLREFSDDAVRPALAPWMPLSPRVPIDRRRRVNRLGLTDHELRAIDHAFDGSRELRDMLGEGFLGRATLTRLLLLLDVFGCLTWEEPVANAQTDPATQLARRVERMQGLNHFEVLGIHWSATSAEVSDAWQRYESEYGALGPWSRVDPQAAARLLALGRSAYGVLADDRTRARHRREAYPTIDAELLGNLLESRVKALAMRGDESGAHRAAQLLGEIAPPRPQQ